MLDTILRTLHLKKPTKKEGRIFQVPLEKTLEIKRLHDAQRNKRGSDMAENFKLWLAIFRAIPSLPEAQYFIRHPDALHAELVEVLDEDQAKVRAAALKMISRHHEEGAKRLGEILMAFTLGMNQDATQSAFDLHMGADGTWRFTAERIETPAPEEA